MAVSFALSGLLLTPLPRSVSRNSSSVLVSVLSYVIDSVAQVSLPDRAQCYPSSGALLRNVPDACCMNLISGFHSCYTNSIPLHWCRCYDGTPLMSMVCKKPITNLTSITRV